MLNKSKLVLVISSAIMCLLLSSVLYFLYQNLTQEVENTKWSENGEWIVFQCAQSGMTSESSLYLVRPDGSEVTRLTTGKKSASSPSWSPNGNEIVFEYSGMLYKIERGTKKLIPLSITDQSYRKAEFPAWSPDGQWIAFVSTSIQNEENILFRVKADGKYQEVLITDITRETISWSSDGQWIVYTTSGEVRKVRLNDNQSQNIIPWNLYDPALSPDGKLIAFSNAVDIYIVQDDGSAKMQLTDLPAAAVDPAWSPDGQWIVFSYFEHSEAQLWKVRVDGSDLQQITSMDCSALSPDWIRMPRSE